MSARPLEHLIYSNAFGPGGSGFRTVTQPGGRSPTDTRLVRDWARSLEPVREHDHCGFACACLRVGSTLYACLARVDGAFARDSRGRGGGVLTHIFLTPVQESCDIGLHTAGLFAEASRLSRPNVPRKERLTAYLETLAGHSTVTVHPPSLHAFRVLGERIMRPFLRISAAALPVAGPLRDGFEMMFQAPAGRRPPEILATASGALPPRLRLHFMWSCGLCPTDSVHLIGRPSSTDLTTGPQEPAGDRYYEWLRERLLRNDIGTLCRILSNWDIRDWSDLLQIIGESNRMIVGYRERSDSPDNAPEGSNRSSSAPGNPELRRAFITENDWAQADGPWITDAAPTAQLGASPSEDSLPLPRAPVSVSAKAPGVRSKLEELLRAEERTFLIIGMRGAGKSRLLAALERVFEPVTTAPVRLGRTLGVAPSSLRLRALGKEVVVLEVPADLFLAPSPGEEEGGTELLEVFVRLSRKVRGIALAVDLEKQWSSAGGVDSREGREQIEILREILAALRCWRSGEAPSVVVPHGQIARETQKPKERLDVPVLVLFTKADELHRLAVPDYGRPILPEGEHPLLFAMHCLPDLYRELLEHVERFHIDFTHSVVLDSTTGVVTHQPPCGVKLSFQWLFTAARGWSIPTRHRIAVHRFADQLTGQAEYWKRLKAPRRLAVEFHAPWMTSFYRREAEAQRRDPMRGALHRS